MASAELKTKKRIKRCFRRKEVYHRWVHSDEHAYNREKCYRIWCTNGYLFVGDTYPRSICPTMEEIESNWEYYKTRCIGIVDRNKKRAILYYNFSFHNWSMKTAIPDDYEIFKTKHPITYFDILSDEKKEELYKLAVRTMIEDLVEYHLVYFYNVLNNKNSHFLRHNADIQKYAKHIIGFSKKYKLGKYKWYHTSLNTAHKFYNYRHRCYSTISIPSIKQLVRNTVFTKEELTYFKYCNFYTFNCYGYGISFKEVENNWNRILDKEDIYKFKYKYNSPCTDTSKLENEPCLWQDFVEYLAEAARKFIKNYENNNIKKSYQNRAEALAKLANTIESWRTSNNTISKVPYEAYIPCFKLNKRGHWYTTYVYSHNSNLQNTQLRLDGNNIWTSRHARVPLKDAIVLFKLFMKIIDNHDIKDPKLENMIPLSGGVGIYNVRGYCYKTKETDYGNPLDYKEWCIVIGCHKLWLDDIIDFIKYYKLEEQFNYQEE